MLPISLSRPGWPRPAAAVLTLLLGYAVPAGAQSGDPSFRVVNNTLKPINEVYVSPVSSSGWGHDRLGADVVPPGGRQLIRLPAGTCLYDIRIVYQQGGAEERRNIDTCGLGDLILGGGAAAPRNAPQGNPSFNLVNRGRQAIAAFYASPASAQNQGPERLGEGNLVQPGQSVPIRLPYGECRYNLRWVWQNGKAQERRNVNACGTASQAVQ
ncbi:hypothetical protein [Roseicella sp. DB1501]|uniref:hypothetical protein n=1 Tax=Roseicella sp. DB1501 TaxID=2730925 RepID=UPI001492F02D|nr:hypothetical protein [Roseicella sp. DB1501]NOG70579.1 hypothetical protein [Roseicella sp. DB1501]